MGKVRYTVCGMAFASKQAVIDHVRHKILGPAAAYESLPPDQFGFMLELLAGHKQAAAKIGPGVEDIWVAPSPEWGSRCFWLRRVDGTTTDFSFRECVTPTTTVHDTLAACRTAVADQVAAVARAAFAAAPTVTCPVCGKPTGKADSDVDHAPPFSFAYLTGRFFGERGVDPAAVTTTGHNDCESRMRLADPALEADWQAYHREHAVLRVLCRRCTVSRRG